MVSGEDVPIQKLVEGFCRECRGDHESGLGFSNGGPWWPENRVKGGGSGFSDLLIWLRLVRSKGGFRRGRGEESSGGSSMVRRRTAPENAKEGGRVNF